MKHNIIYIYLVLSNTKKIIYFYDQLDSLLFFCSSESFLEQVVGVHRCLGDVHAEFCVGADD